ncbi:hypothetical protein HanPSC8_Chr01g0040401 [Helianthus annuus]|nr:hypothetical protein HanPSC8_Chr01g0040401 [Helianthus annuus]
MAFFIRLKRAFSSYQNHLLLFYTMRWQNIPSASWNSASVKGRI